MKNVPKKCYKITQTLISSQLHYYETSLDIGKFKYITFLPLGLNTL